jgi:hypothetical protein
MPPSFTNGPSPCRIRLLSPTGQSAVGLSPDAVIPDTAEWCYPAQAAKWCPGCPRHGADDQPGRRGNLDCEGFLGRGLSRQ